MFQKRSQLDFGSRGFHFHPRIDQSLTDRSRVNRDFDVVPLGNEIERVLERLQCDCKVGHSRQRVIKLILTPLLVLFFLLLLGLTQYAYRRESRCGFCIEQPGEILVLCRPPLAFRRSAHHSHDGLVVGANGVAELRGRKRLDRMEHVCHDPHRPQSVGLIDERGVMGSVTSDRLDSGDRIPGARRSTAMPLTARR
jgi:hypothetical protein